jgi:putative intracellular protease/amidase
MAGKAGAVAVAGSGDSRHMQNDFVSSEPKAFAIRDGRLVTGQQQYSGRKVAQAVIEMLGV